MPFEIQSATIDDVPEIVALFSEAFANDRIASYLFQDVPHQVSWERDVKWYTTAFENFESNGERFFKAVNTSTRYRSTFERRTFKGVTVGSTNHLPW